MYPCWRKGDGACPGFNLLTLLCARSKDALSQLPAPLLIAVDFCPFGTVGQDTLHLLEVAWSWCFIIATEVINTALKVCTRACTCVCACVYRCRSTTFGSQFFPSLLGRSLLFLGLLCKLQASQPVNIQPVYLHISSC